jgi:hypothetical protein
MRHRPDHQDRHGPVAPALPRIRLAAAVPEDQEDVNRPERPRDGYRGQAPWPDAAASALTAGQNQGGATFFRCGGCGAAAVFVQRERGYGRLVQGFFDRHERCGDAVQISAVRPPAGTSGERAPAGI